MKLEWLALMQDFLFTCTIPLRDFGVCIGFDYDRQL